MRLLISLFFVAYFFGVVSCQTIFDVVAGRTDLSILASVVTSPSYAAVKTLLQDPSVNLTLFAPTDNAFRAAITAGLVNTSNVANTVATLQYHVLPVKVLSTAIPTSTIYPNTLLTNPAYVNLGGSGAPLGAVKKGTSVILTFGIPGVDQSTVTVADLSATNGVVHVVDTVLIYPQPTSSVAVKAKLNSLVTALQTAGLVSAVDTTASITIFAPVDSGFTAANFLNNDPKDVLLYHVFSGVNYAKDVVKKTTLTSLNGKTFAITTDANGAYIGGAKILTTDVLTKNAVVHVIDRVIGVPSALNTIVQNALTVPALSTLVSVVTDPRYAPVLSALSGLSQGTLFAPSNDAFTKAGVNVSDVATVTAVLQYHLLLSTIPSSKINIGPTAVNTALTNPAYAKVGPGKGQVLLVYKDFATVSINFGDPTNKAKVIVADVTASNGVVHVIDTVLLPPGLTSATASKLGFSTLVSAVVKANLVSAIDTTQAITIFAPTNLAFSKLSPNTTVDLASILTYHVVPALAYSSSLSNGMKINTLNGQTLTVKIDSVSGVVTLLGATNSARITATDYLTSNAVIHVIDTVLVPGTTPPLFSSTGPSHSFLTSAPSLLVGVAAVFMALALKNVAL